MSLFDVLDEFLQAERRGTHGLPLQNHASLKINTSTIQENKDYVLPCNLATFGFLHQERVMVFALHGEPGLTVSV
ncbi:hypothetical protein L1987_80871 [Smallanthus sonchifolius]|uniref:Uncharacterized protein n=1 Tax=Smallanthus sonchifolius TaxID=185202 RepID=A0ACB8YP31_9ASTR|nr:hypothetical protein L1987_80871 [Smallanthus sonchifolius]